MCNCPTFRQQPIFIRIGFVRTKGFFILVGDSLSIQTSRQAYSSYGMLRIVWSDTAIVRGPVITGTQQQTERMRLDGFRVIRSLAQDRCADSPSLVAPPPHHHSRAESMVRPGIPTGKGVHLASFYATHPELYSQSWARVSG